MQNVAGATKKTIMSSMIFVGYCLGNIISPQLLKSQTRAQHYPLMYGGIIFWYVCVAADVVLFITVPLTEITTATRLRLSAQWPCIASCAGRTSAEIVRRRATSIKRKRIDWPFSI